MLAVFSGKIPDCISHMLEFSERSIISTRSALPNPKREEKRRGEEKGRGEGEKRMGEENGREEKGKREGKRRREEGREELGRVE